MNGRTALHKAATSRNEETTKLLIEADANVNAKDGRGQSPLYWAAPWSRVSITKQKIEAGAEVKAVNNEGDKILSSLTKHDRTWRLIDPDDTVISRLKYAISARHNTENSLGWTERYLAAKKECSEVEILLLDTGAVLSDQPPSTMGM